MATRSAGIDIKDSIITSSILPSDSIEEEKPSKRQRSIQWKFSPLVKDQIVDRPIVSQIEEKESISMSRVLCPSPKTDKQMLGLWKSPSGVADKASDMPSVTPDTPAKSTKTTLEASHEDSGGFFLYDIEDLSFGSPISSEIDPLLNPNEENHVISLPESDNSQVWVFQVEDVIHPPQTSGVTLYCRRSTDNQLITLELGGIFADSPYQVGMIIHLIGKHANYGSSLLQINDPQQFQLVVHPERAISITTIADAVACPRKATISTLMHAPSARAPPTVHLAAGSIVHEVFEEAIIDDYNLGSTELTFSNLYHLIVAAIQRHVLTIYACGIDESEAFRHVQEVLKSFPAWKQKFFRPEPHPNGLLVEEMRCGLIPTNLQACIARVFAIEKSFCSNKYGLKGKVDSLVLLRFPSSQSNELHSILVPLELKTGRSTNSVAHRAQTLLYTLLLADHYGLEINFGLLYYMASDVILRIQASSIEIQALLMTRNRLVVASMNKNLPDPINNPQNCRQCSHLHSCGALLRLSRQTHPILNPVLQGLLEAASATSILDRNFYFKWDRFLSLEEAIGRQSLANSGSVMVTLMSSETAPKLGFGRYIATFEVFDAILDQDSLQTGDPVDIYDQDGREVAIGFVSDTFRGNGLTINVDRDLSQALLLNKNGQWESLYQVGKAFCVKRDELLTSYSLSRANLIQLFYPMNEHLHGLIVRTKPPNFFDMPTLTLQNCSLNAQQQDAIQHCCRAQDYALILGMPGTGKTTTLVELITHLVQNGKRVLVSSYTHSAVDNLLFKVKARGVLVLRVGNADRIDKRLHEDILSSENFPTVSELSQALQERLVIGTSALGINHIIFARLRFDYAIIDEASQISVPSVLGPLLLAEKFILVGDHYQLPPLVRHPQSNSEGLNISLFKILAEAHPRSVVTLSRQFRMCEDIQKLANHLIYRGRLTCGSAEVAQGKLELSLAHYFCNVCGDQGDCWVRRVLEAERRVAFLDTDLIKSAAEESIADSYGNQLEANIIFRLVNAMVDSGVTAQQIAIITTYRPQVRIIESTLGIEGPLEVSTIDKYQGRDQDCILFSLVRSNANNNIGLLLSDWHRLNVAFTRARKKIVLIGSGETVLGHPMMVNLRTLIENHGWWIRLPSDALDHFSI